MIALLFLLGWSHMLLQHTSGMPSALAIQKLKNIYRAMSTSRHGSFACLFVYPD